MFVSGVLGGPSRARHERGGLCGRRRALSARCWGGNAALRPPRALWVAHEPVPARSAWRPSGRGPLDAGGDALRVARERRHRGTHAWRTGRAGPREGMVPPSPRSRRLAGDRRPLLHRERCRRRDRHLPRVPRRAALSELGQPGDDLGVPIRWLARAVRVRAIGHGRVARPQTRPSESRVACLEDGAYRPDVSGRPWHVRQSRLGTGEERSSRLRVYVEERRGALPAERAASRATAYEVVFADRPSTEYWVDAGTGESLRK